MLGGNPGGAERPILLLRMLQDQQFDVALNGLDALANAERHRLLAMRAFRDLDELAGRKVICAGHCPLYAAGRPASTAPRYSAGAGSGCGRYRFRNRSISR